MPSECCSHPVKNVLRLCAVRLLQNWCCLYTFAFLLLLLLGLLLDGSRRWCLRRCLGVALVCKNVTGAYAFCDPAGEFLIFRTVCCATGCVMPLLFAIRVI